MSLAVVKLFADPLKARARADRSGVEDAPAVSADTAATHKSSALVLRVLTGPHANAEVPVRHHRLLIGNLDDECDVVLDVGATGPHACLVRTSRDGWTVMSVSGHLWVQETWVPPQQTQDLHSGDVLTLGEVAFSIADRETVDWTEVQVPERRQPAGPVEKAPAAEAEASWRRVLKRVWPAWAARAATETRMPRAALPTRERVAVIGLVVLGLLLAVAATVLITVSTADDVPRAAQRPSVADEARAALAGTDGIGELAITVAPQDPGKAVIGGYLPRANAGVVVGSVLAQHHITFERHWALVDELQQALGARLGLRTSDGASSLRYLGQGAFAAAVSPSSVDALDAPLRRVFADIPALRAMTLEVQVPGDNAGARGAIPVRYARGAGGAVDVTGMEKLRLAVAAPVPVVREVRMGAVPSVVLDDGARYFEGAVLPGGAVLTRIRSDHIEVQFGSQLRHLPARESEMLPR